MYHKYSEIDFSAVDIKTSVYFQSSNMQDTIMRCRVGKTETVVCS